MASSKPECYPAAASGIYDTTFSNDQVLKFISNGGMGISNNDFDYDEPFFKVLFFGVCSSMPVSDGSWIGDFYSSDEEAQNLSPCDIAYSAETTETSGTSSLLSRDYEDRAICHMPYVYSDCSSPKEVNSLW